MKNDTLKKVAYCFFIFIAWLSKSIAYHFEARKAVSVIAFCACLVLTAVQKNRGWQFLGVLAMSIVISIYDFNFFLFAVPALLIVLACTEEMGIQSDESTRAKKRESLTGVYITLCIFVIVSSICYSCYKIGENAPDAKEGLLRIKNEYIFLSGILVLLIAGLLRKTKKQKSKHFNGHISICVATLFFVNSVAFAYIALDEYENISSRYAFLFSLGAELMFLMLEEKHIMSIAGFDKVHKAK